MYSLYCFLSYNVTKTINLIRFHFLQIANQAIIRLTALQISKRTTSIESLPCYGLQPCYDGGSVGVKKRCFR